MQYVTVYGCEMKRIGVMEEFSIFGSQGQLQRSHSRKSENCVGYEALVGKHHSNRLAYELLAWPHKRLNSWQCSVRCKYYPLMSSSLCSSCSHRAFSWKCSWMCFFLCLARPTTLVRCHLHASFLSEYDTLAPHGLDVRQATMKTQGLSIDPVFRLDAV